MPKNMLWYTVSERPPLDNEEIIFVARDTFNQMNEVRYGTVNHEVDIIGPDNRPTGESFWFEDGASPTEQLKQMEEHLEPGETLALTYICDRYLLSPDTVYSPTDALFALLPEGY